MHHIADLEGKTAKEQVEEVMRWLKEMTKEKLKTRAGRDDIRRTFGCQIEGFEEEETTGLPGGLFNSPML